MQISTKFVQRRYDRIGPLYQAMDRMIDDSQRTELLSAAHGDVLEVGVGTGANIPFYPLGATVIGIDLSSRMLSYAKRRAREARAQVRLLQMDVQHLSFPPNTFDTVVSSCVFCTVPDPIQGLSEIRRVLKPDGVLLMLEHMQSEHRLIAWALNAINPLSVA